MTDLNLSVTQLVFVFVVTTTIFVKLAAVFVGVPRRTIVACGIAALMAGALMYIVYFYVGTTMIGYILAATSAVFAVKVVLMTPLAQAFAVALVAFLMELAVYTAWVSFDLYAQKHFALW